MSTELNELKTPEFETLLVEEKLIAKDLPAAIYNKINVYKMGIGRYKKNPTEKALGILNASDIEICDMIQDYLEKDAEEETPEQKAAAQKKIDDDKAASDKEKTDKEKADKEAADKVEADRIEAERKQKEEDEKSKNPEDKTEDQTTDQKKAAQVESELTALYNAEKKSLTLEELKKAAPVCFSDIWHSYKDGEENGIMTSRYLLKETEKETFTLSKL